jgi:hypothetical protein
MEQILMAQRRPIMSVLALILAVCLLGGSSLSDTWLWQCRHASRLIATASEASPNAMPCHMANMPMTAMACCAKISPVPSAQHGAVQTVHSAPCRPTLTQTAFLSPAVLSTADLDLWLLASADSMPMPFTPGLRLAPILSASSPRPPPSDLLPASPPHHSPDLRAPPVA